MIAGIVMTTMLVPVGIAYAEGSGLPGIYGLYATIFPLIAYAISGPSRILVMGHDSALAPLILSVVGPLASGDPHRAIALSGMMALVSGVACVAAGLAKLVFITELLSKPIRYGYMNGIALTVLLSQIPKLFGFSVKADGLLRQAWGTVEKLGAGEANYVAFAIGAGTLVLILLLKLWPRVPGILIAVIAATLAVSFLDLANRADVAVLGELPQGLPAPRIPWIEMADIVPVLEGGLVGAIATALLLVAAPNLLQSLPQTTLAAVVIASSQRGEGLS